MENHSILEIAILEMGRMKKGVPFSPSDVVRWIYPQDWRYFMSEVRVAMMNLYKNGNILLTQKGIPVKYGEEFEEEVQITLIHKTN
ncbi:DUF3253 domain-containing protein [Shivajiella indica]|uniref:DUF3253 domain-containing protein n=1 Tax=Shivajiella indica TaxID=872115 RepID=A0ABW5BBT1_9BACT